MKDKINIPLATMAATDLYEAIVALKYDTKYPDFHREDIERHFASLADELGFTVSPLTALDTARLADDARAMAPVRALEAAE